MDRVAILFDYLFSLFFLFQPCEVSCFNNYLHFFCVILFYVISVELMPPFAVIYDLQVVVFLYPFVVLFIFT